MVQEVGRRGAYLSLLQGMVASGGAAEVQPDFVGRDQWEEARNAVVVRLR